MRYSTVLLSLLPACLAAPSLVPRGDQDRYSQLLSTIGEIGSATADLTEAVNAFDPSLFTVVQDSVKVAVAEGKVDLNTLVATYWAHDSCNFTATESKTIVDTLAGQIGPIQASLTALQNKAPQFKSIPLGLGQDAVLFDLNTLKVHTDNFIDAVTAKVTADQAGLLGFGKSILDNSFLAAINAF